ncbi:hypothetical protein Pelo_8299 [Pelomyxa schiedti]|nr:hypothetical protein Pelo_8299 [Pelomyxa schiedti]
MVIRGLRFNCALHSTSPNASRVMIQSLEQRLAQMEGQMQAQFYEMQRQIQLLLLQQATINTRKRVYDSGWIQCPSFSYTSQVDSPHGLSIHPDNAFVLTVMMRDDATGKVWFLCDDVHTAACGWRCTVTGYDNANVWCKSAPQYKIRFVLKEL